MKSRLLRIFLIAVVTTVVGSGLDYGLEIETSLGLDSLFQIRGVRQPPEEVVIVAMDETSETQLGLGQDLTTWRSFHPKLIEQLQAQGVKLIAFDLQFLLSQPQNDSLLARQIKTAGNVLMVECVQKLLRGTEDFFGRDECSESNKLPFVETAAQTPEPLPEQLIAMRKIAPLRQIADAALDHAPVYLTYDSKSSVIREVWIYLDALGEMPNLPLVVWLHYLQLSGSLPGVIPSEQKLSDWLTQMRRDCVGNGDALAMADSLDPDLESRLRKLICGGDSRYLDFYGPQKTLRMESYSDVYFGNVRDLKDKVVFVGKANRRFAPGRTDYFATPYVGAGKTAGVEILATEFANLLEDRFVELPLSFLAVGCVYGLLLGLLLVVFDGMAGVALCLLLTGSYAVAVIAGFNVYAVWLPIAVPVLVQLPLASLLAFLLARQDLLSERQRILAFVGQVFPQWLESVPGGQQRLPHESSAEELKRDVHGLCLATDIEGYTTVAARYSSEQMWALLNRYYQALGQPVEAHSGFVVDVTGDAMMAVWLQENAVVRSNAACRAALEIGLAVDSFNRQANDFELPTRIGLYEGDLTLGPVDAAQGVYYRAIGDTVNTASRIQGVNKFLDTHVLASASIAKGLQGIVCRPVGVFRLIGRELPVDLVEIVGLAGAVDQHRCQQLKLFETGLTAFQLGDWPLAVSCFQDVLSDYGYDGPTKFYLQLAIEYQVRPPEGWDRVVTLERK
jgi:adenylate cyclase